MVSVNISYLSFLCTKGMHGGKISTKEKSKLRNELESINNVRETDEKRSFQNKF